MNSAVSDEVDSVETSRKHKQVGVESVGKSNAKRRKLNGSEEELEGAGRDFADMPEHVIHHIISLLHPKAAAQLCVLSKKWNSVWNSFPILDFDERFFKKLEQPVTLNENCYLELLGGKAWEMEMLSVIDRSLQTRLRQKLTIEKFKLSVSSAKFFQSFIGDWVATAIDLKVKNLSVSVKSLKSGSVPEIPATVLSVSSIVVLNLFECKWETSVSDGIDLPHLRKLSLGRLSIGEKMLRKLITGCPSIQELRIQQCFRLRKIVISTAPLLKRFDVCKCPVVKSITVDAPSLHSFCYNGIRRQCCNFDLSECKSLKELVLEYPRLTDEMFERQIVEFPNLEKLNLLYCSTLKNIHIPCEKLKKLVILKCNRLVEAVIHALSLYSLEYKGSSFPIALLNPMSLEEVKLSFDSFEKTPTTHLGHFAQRRSVNDKLRDLIQNLDRSKGLKIMSRRYWMKALVLREYIIGKPYPSYVVGGLQLQISRSVENLIDNFLRDQRWPTVLNVYVISCPGSDFPLEVREKLNAQKQDPKCCSLSNRKCWRHYLKDVVSFPPQDIENKMFEVDDLKRAIPRPKLTSLGLTWL